MFEYSTVELLPGLSKKISNTVCRTEFTFREPPMSIFGMTYLHFHDVFIILNAIKGHGKICQEIENDLSPCDTIPGRKHQLKVHNTCIRKTLRLVSDHAKSSTRDKFQEGRFGCVRKCDNPRMFYQTHLRKTSIS